MITEWDKLINRVRQETTGRLNKHQNNGHPRASAVAVSVKMLVDCDGNPIHWIVESKDIEPLAHGRALLELL